MTKLKTLKDIKYDKLFAPFKNKPSIEPVVIIDYKQKLRQEVIKWIKHDLEYVKKITLNNVEYKNFPLSNILKEDRAFIRTWMERFNITEEDLK